MRLAVQNRRSCRRGRPLHGVGAALVPRPRCPGAGGGAAHTGAAAPAERGLRGGRGGGSVVFLAVAKFVQMFCVVCS